MSGPCRIRSPETWEAARLAWLDGVCADEVCARFDLGLSALRKRAKLHGWRRTDQAGAEPFDDEDDPDDLPDMDDPALADLARRRMGVASRGRRTGPASGAPARRPAAAEAGPATPGHPPTLQSGTRNKSPFHPCPPLADRYLRRVGL